MHRLVSVRSNAIALIFFDPPWVQAYQGSDLLGALVLAQWVSKVTANCVSAACASLKSQANGFAYSITNNLDSAGNTPTYTYINMVRLCPNLPQAAVIFTSVSDMSGLDPTLKAAC